MTCLVVKPVGTGNKKNIKILNVIRGVSNFTVEKSETISAGVVLGQTHKHCWDIFFKALLGSLGAQDVLCISVSFFCQQFTK